MIKIILAITVKLTTILIGIRTGKSKTLEQQDTDLEIDSDMIIEIVQCTGGAALVIGIIVLLHRLRNRFNRIVHKPFPKLPIHIRY